MNFEDVLKLISYKPKTKFMVRKREGFLCLRIDMKVLDEGNPTEQILITREDVIPPHLLEIGDLSKTLGWIRSRLSLMENHEVDEWFKLNGTKINDPHFHGHDDTMPL